MYAHKEGNAPEYERVSGKHQGDKTKVMEGDCASIVLVESDELCGVTCPGIRRH